MKVGTSRALQDEHAVSESLRKRGYNFSPERIVDLAKQSLIPHVIVDNHDLRFFLKETTDYITENFIVEKKPIQYPRPYPVYIAEPDAAKEGLERIPKALLGMTSFLYRVEMHVYLGGVYFLCNEGRIVYVGCSTNVYARVAAHRADKKFDSAFYIVVPEEHQRVVESAFIEILKPELNGGLSVPRGKQGGLYVATEKRDCTADDIVARVAGIAAEWQPKFETSWAFPLDLDKRVPGSSKTWVDKDGGIVGRTCSRDRFYGTKEEALKERDRRQKLLNGPRQIGTVSVQSAWW